MCSVGDAAERGLEVRIEGSTPLPQEVALHWSIGFLCSFYRYSLWISSLYPSRLGGSVTTEGLSFSSLDSIGDGSSLLLVSSPLCFVSPYRTLTAML